MIATAFASILVVPPTVMAVGTRDAAYVGGTTKQLNSSQAAVTGRLDTSAERHLVFTVDEKPLKGQRLRIAYQSILNLEYGQNVGRRVTTAMGTSVLLGPVGLLPLVSKKREHYLTIAYTDDNEIEQVAVFELGKDIVRSTLAVIEVRSGKPIDYLDDDARRLSR
jgi:hypothetical protein